VTLQAILTAIDHNRRAVGEADAMIAAWQQQIGAARQVRNEAVRQLAELEELAARMTGRRDVSRAAIERHRNGAAAKPELRLVARIEV